MYSFAKQCKFEYFWQIVGLFDYLLTILCKSKDFKVFNNTIPHKQFWNLSNYISKELLWIESRCPDQEVSIFNLLRHSFTCILSNRYIVRFLLQFSCIYIRIMPVLSIIQLFPQLSLKPTTNLSAKLSIYGITHWLSAFTSEILHYILYFFN